MRTVGLTGGTSWHASAVYHRLINESVHARAGGHANAPSVMVTVDFYDTTRLHAEMAAEFVLSG